MMKKVVPACLTICLCIAFVVSPGAEEKPAPEVVTLDGITEKYEPVTFNHNTHAMMAGNCAKCHHQHPSLENQLCKDCHLIDSAEYKRSVVHTFWSCRSCHGAYDIDNPAKPGLKVAYHRVCFDCHRGMGDIGIDPKGCTEMCHAKKSEKISMIRLHNMPPGQ